MDWIFNRLAPWAVLLGMVAVALTPMSAAARTVRIAALGDSLTAGYGLPDADGFVPQLQRALRAKGHDVEILNAGVSGDTTAGGASRLDWVLGDRPDAVIVALGANDMLRALPPAEARRNIEDILRRLAADRRPVLLAGMYAQRNLGQTYTRAFDAIFPELADAYGAIHYPFFLDGVAGDPALNQPDMIHPNREGVAIMVARILPAVERLIARVRDGGA